MNGVETKLLCAGLWILPRLCDYRATKLPFGEFPDVAGECLISEQDNLELAKDQTDAFRPRFDSAGLLTAVVQDADSGRVLMVAFMDEEALQATRRTGFAHFHSRSRGRLWKKGESSGHVLHVQAIEVDCDQDAVLLKARPAGPTCHTGATSCFFRELKGDALTRIEG